MNGKKTLLIAAGMTSSLLASSAKIENDNIVLKSSMNPNTVNIRVIGPEGFKYSANRNGGDTSISRSEINATKDGVYKYEFTEVEIIGERDVTDNFNGRGQTVQKIVKSKITSGHFRVKNNAIINDLLVEDSATTPLTRPLHRPKLRPDLRERKNPFNEGDER